MKNQLTACRSAVLLLLLSALYSPRLMLAQGTAFSYQGRLDNGGGPATGIYDLTFAVYDSAGIPTALIAGPLTNSATPVTNGLFTVFLDFGAGVFTGPNRWLEIGVRSNAIGPFTTLTPRQPLMSAPYAVFAGGANAAGITGTLPPATIANGSIGASQLASGAALSNLNASGQSGVPGSGIILSATNDNPALQNAGYVKIGTVQGSDTWLQHSSVAAPGGRDAHSAIWTGTEMIVWGGRNSNVLNDGGRYNPAIDAWTALSTNDAPVGRIYHTAVWTGTEMIVWGGLGGSGLLSDDGRYNPATDTWTALSTNNAPSMRTGHTAVWTGSEMIVWGGTRDGLYYIFNDGARYNPLTDTWTAISTNATPRCHHTAVWTGTEMIVWGGFNLTFIFVNGIPTPQTVYLFGERYDRLADTWTPAGTSGDPGGRVNHAAIWTGSEMMVWGGDGQPGGYFQANGRYNPGTDSWTGVSTINAPAARHGHSAVWTGTEMILWGGDNQTGNLFDGGRYNPTSDSWRPLTLGTPGPRTGHTAVWTGVEMVVWGGGDGSSRPNETWSLTPGNPMYLYLKP